MSCLQRLYALLHSPYPPDPPYIRDPLSDPADPPPKLYIGAS